MAANEASHLNTVAEVPGLLGTFTFPERLLQRIWLLKKFSSHACTLSDGRSLRVLNPGQWNRIAGPDFHKAHLEINGHTVIGDVEIHFENSDWDNHGHATDPAYENVMLHVVLHQRRPIEQPARTATGREIPLLVLLPYLHCSLEEFAIEDAIESITGRQTSLATEALLQLSMEERRRILIQNARIRWEQKVAFATARIERSGWEEACHQTALEILGYRFNRAQMLATAMQFPWKLWQEKMPTAEEVWSQSIEDWQTQAVRPANHPKLRLEQYARWMQQSSFWPRYLSENVLNTQLPENPAANTIHARRFEGFSEMHSAYFERICGRSVGGGRLDTLICNGFLPLLAAYTRAPYFARWFHWWPSETGSSLEELRHSGVCDGRDQPLCEGFAQGMLLYVSQFKSQ